MKTRRGGGGALFRFLRTFDNSKQNPPAYDTSIHPRGISEFATTYPFTNDYPFDFAQSLLLLHKRELGGSVVLRSARHSWHQVLFSSIWLREGDRSWWEVTTSMGS
jgi:hypothetical protein